MCGIPETPNFIYWTWKKIGFASRPQCSKTLHTLKTSPSIQILFLDRLYQQSMDVRIGNVCVIFGPLVLVFAQAQGDPRALDG